jgi:hypothetical protein
MGQPRFPDATNLLVTADADGSNGYRVKLWKVELKTAAFRSSSQAFAYVRSAWLPIWLPNVMKGHFRGAMERAERADR